MPILGLFAIYCKTPSNPEQAWLIPQPSRNSWGVTREFNKLSLLSQIIGYKPRINNKNDTKCMGKYLPEVQEPESSESVMREIIDMISKPSGSKELSGDLSIYKPRVGVSSRMVKNSRPTPKISHTRVYTYDEMIEHQEKLNDSDDFEFDISDVEKKF